MRPASITVLTLGLLVALAVVGRAVVAPALAPKRVIPSGIVDSPIGPIKAPGRIELHLPQSERAYDAVQVMLGCYSQAPKVKLRLCSAQEPVPSCVQTTRWPVENDQIVLPLPGGVHGGTIEVFVDELKSESAPGAEQIAFWGHAGEPLAIGLFAPTMSSSLRELFAWR